MNVIQCFTPFISIGLFGVMKGIDAGNLYSVRWKKMILAVGDTAFGIYLMEDIIRNQVVKFIVHINANDFIIAVVYTLLTFAIGAVVVFVMKKIPVLRRMM